MIRRLRAYLCDESGVAAGFLLLGLATIVVTGIAYVQNHYDPGDPRKQQVRDCVAKAKAAVSAIQTALVVNPDQKFNIDDPNAVTLQRCQELLKPLIDEEQAKKPGTLSNILQSGYASIGQCAIVEPTTPASAIAGRELKTHVIATIPFGSFGDDFGVGATLSGGGVSAGTGLTRRQGSDKLVTYAGDLVIPGASSKNVANGATSTLVVTAAGTAMEGADGQEQAIRPANGTCPFGLVPVSGVCRITCSVSRQAVTWKVPPPIEATLSAQTTDDSHATLTWETKNATKVTLKGGGIPGTLTVPPSSSLPVGRLTKDDTYTLTASAPDVPDKSVSTTVPAAKGTYVVTLSAGGNELTTDSSVTVGGKVTPVPPPGTVVAVGVNGNVVATVGVDGAGLYTASITLPRTTTVGSLVLTNPSRNLTVCGSHPASTVTLANSASPAAVQNFVNAAVAKQGGGIASNDASLVITHAVKILSATVTWSGQCSGSNDSFSVAGRILRQGESATLGSIPCGIQCPSTGLSCSPVARVSVSTSVGSLFQDAVWTVKIP